MIKNLIFVLSGIFYIFMSQSVCHCHSIHLSLLIQLIYRYHCGYYLEFQFQLLAFQSYINTLSNLNKTQNFKLNQTILLQFQLTLNSCIYNIYITNFYHPIVMIFHFTLLPYKPLQTLEFIKSSILKLIKILLCKGHSLYFGQIVFASNQVLFNLFWVICCICKHKFHNLGLVQFFADLLIVHMI